METLKTPSDGTEMPSKGGFSPEFHNLGSSFLSIDRPVKFDQGHPPLAYGLVDEVD
jgi:hypothetical protein